MMTIVMGSVGLPLPPPVIPKLVSHLREGFYGSSNPLQALFVSPALLDIWQCIEAFWQQPLSKIPDFLRVQGFHTLAFLLSMRPLLLSCNLSRLDGPQQHDREML